MAQYNANQLLARAIIKAVNERESSWNVEAKAYGITITEACYRATPNKDRANLVNLLLTAAWNDAQSWAQGIEEKL